MLNLLVIVVIFGGLILIHELGHFLVAKWSGVWVKHFGIGFGPHLRIEKDGHETTYSIGIIPLGGFIMLYGNKPEEVADDLRHRSFYYQPYIKKLAIDLGGVIANFLVVFPALFLLFAAGFQPIFPPLSNIVLESKRGIIASPLQVDQVPTRYHNTLLSGDQIIAIDNRPIKTVADFIEHTDINKPFLLKTERNGVIRTSLYNPKSDKGKLTITPEKIKGSNLTNIAILSVASGIAFDIFCIVGTYYGVYHIIAHRDFRGGPIGLISLISSEAHRGWAHLVQLFILINAAVAGFNFLPILPLDGGHILLATIERLRRKEFSEKSRIAIALPGLIFLLALLVAVTIGDIIRLFR